ncbi:MAG: tetratricopeptide repeat protein, partial [Proteobacteria bacterium]|nr:tetratricopeptide repeat protein [Pseudomonadota bacterium]
KISLNNSWRIDFLRGQLQSNQIAKDGVIKFFESSLSASNDAKNIVIPYLIATLQSERQGQALVNELAAWQKRFPHRLFQLSLAMALSNSNHYAESHKIYTALQKEYPDFSESFINDAIVLYTHLNQPKLALKLLSLALEVNPQLDNAKKSLVKAHMAKIHLEHTGLYDEARNLFAESIVNAKNPVEWLAFSHKTYEGLHRLQDFVVLLENLRTELPGSSYLYALQGEVLSESLAQHEQAIESFSLAIILDPDRSEFYNGMGLAYYRMQKLDKALLTFHEASKMDPQDATARYNEACVLAIMGRPKEALGSLKEAISLDPGLQKTALLDNDFASIRITEQFRNITSSPITATQTP